MIDLRELITLGNTKFDKHLPGERPWDRAKGRWSTTEEGIVLYTLCLAYDITNVIECGTAHGYSASWMAASGATVHTYDVENCKKVWDHFETGVSAQNIHCHNGPFLSAVLPISKEPTLFFIDGEHGRGHVIGDWEKIKDDVKAGDVVVFHDNGPGSGGVPRAMCCLNLESLPRMKKMHFPTQHGMTAFYVGE